MIKIIIIIIIIIIVIIIIIIIINIANFLNRFCMITAAILVCQNKETASMLMHQKHIWGLTSFIILTQDFTSFNLSTLYIF